MMTEEEVCELLGVKDRRTVERWAEKAGVPRLKIGRAVRYPRVQVLKAAGLPMTELEQKIHDAMQRYTDAMIPPVDPSSHDELWRQFKEVSDRLFGHFGNATRALQEADRGLDETRPA